MNFTDYSLNTLLTTCIDNHVSDIHFLRRSAHGEIRCRLHGTLTPSMEIASDSYDHLISMIKLKSGMDVSLYHSPQDGRFTYNTPNGSQDLRTSSLPTAFGEDMVVRVLHKKEKLKSLPELGFSEIRTKTIQDILGNRSGMFLVTGPTGSGKTTTLYTCLSYLAQDIGRMVVSIEDPIESILPNVRQTALNTDIHYDGPRALKAILRQDPDILLIGEIRDAHMAHLATEAAYTGHLVLSSLHTSDVASSLRRLHGFGIDPFLIRHAIVGILSQRLLPIPCLFCQQTLDTHCAQCHGTQKTGRRIESELLHVRNTDYWEDFLSGKTPTDWSGSTYYDWH